MKETSLLSEDERREIAEELTHYPDARAASIEALKVVQRHRRWVSDEALEGVAALLGMTPAELDSVATFYDKVFRRPVGRHVILICDSISCWVMGYEALRAALEAKLGVGLGQTTPDGRFTLLPIPCLGCCDHAPALMVDDDLHTNLSPDDVGALLDRYADREEA